MCEVDVQMPQFDEGSIDIGQVKRANEEKNG